MKNLLDRLLKQLESGNQIPGELNLYRFHQLTGISRGSLSDLKAGKRGILVMAMTELAINALAECSKPRRKKVAKDFFESFRNTEEKA